MTLTQSKYQIFTKITKKIFGRFKYFANTHTHTHTQLSVK